VIGASAGGVQALCEVIGGLPADLPAAVFVVLHVPPYPGSALPAILNRCGRLPSAHAEEGMAFQAGRVYVAPPDRHMLLGKGRIHLNRGPRENGHRPALDVLYRSAARLYGRRVIGVVLTGNLDDGTAGLLAIKRYGGLAVVQDPAEADYPGMPESAIENVEVDHVVPLAEMPALLTDLVARELPEGAEEEEEPVSDFEPSEMPAHLGVEGGNLEEGYGLPSGLTCPECGGALFDKREEAMIGFRCRVGHAYSPESLAAAQSQEIDAALWAAVRALEEHAALSRRLEQRMASSGKSGIEIRYARRANDAERYADVLRRILTEDEKKSEGDGRARDQEGGEGRAHLTPRRAIRQHTLD
jgi:two-component system chemotaxis response regulator CheB